MNICDHCDKSNIILEKKLANCFKGLVKSIQAYGQQYAKWMLKSNKYSGHIIFFHNSELEMLHLIDAWQKTFQVI